MTRVLLLFALGCGPLWGLCRPTMAAERTSVALTVTASATADRQLAEGLIALVESNVLADESLSLVERRQIDLALQELALSRARSADESLQLGRLVTADLLVMLELRPSDEKASKPSAFLRVVEARTAAIRGITVAMDIDEASLEEIAEQFARYVSTVVHQPRTQTITVAVAPFESVGRFDRLRPLELGIRDLVTVRLLWRTLARPLGKGDANAETGKSAPPPFQVLQRSSLDQLLRELDLVQSGLADKDLLPKTLPDRQAAFLVKGELDERQVDGKFTIVVRGELLHAATAQVRDSFEFECPPSELESRLAVRVDRFAMLLGMTDESRIESAAGHVGHEAQSLKRLALRDLHRFRRLSPTDFGHREFRLPGEETSRGTPRLARPDTPLGKALLRKSIDRLESVLFIHPEDAEAAYGLGFCCSLHEPGIYQPARADDFLRNVSSVQPQSELAALALAFLGEIAFHDQTGQLDPAQRDATAERLWFAFEHMPEKFRDHRWPRILELFASTRRTAEQNAALLTKAAPYAEQAGKQHRHQLAGQVQGLALRLAHQAKNDPVPRAKALELLHHWSEGTDTQLADFGRQGLAAISAGDKDFLTAAILYEESALKLADATAIEDRHKHDVQLVHAAKNYRLAQQPDRALRLLKSFKPATSLVSILVGMHGYEMGACYEALGEQEQARAAYLRATEECPGIVPNSDIVQRIRELGGVPLHKDRGIDVRYFTLDGKQPILTTALATDGTRLFLGGEGVSMFDLDTETLTPLKTDLGKVTSLKIHQGILWVGTAGGGLWRSEIGSPKWIQIGTERGLPDLRVTSLAFHGSDVYVGVGSPAAGGLVRIDAAGTIHAVEGTDAPRVAPTHLVVDDKRLLARTLEAIHERSSESGKWTLHQADPNRRPVITPRLFAGTTHLWASHYGRELTNWDADAAANQFFQPAWYDNPGTKAGYLVNFIAERGEEVWFGGQPWDQFVSSGLYRFDRKSGAFQRFSPRDGFQTVYTQSISDGLWLRDRLWLATSSGLCVVTPRDGLPASSPEVQTRVMP